MVVTSAIVKIISKYSYFFILVLFKLESINYNIKKKIQSRDKHSFKTVYIVILILFLIIWINLCVGLLNHQEKNI